MGGCLLFLPIMLFVAYPAGEFIVERLFGMALVGIGVVCLGALLQRKSNIVYKAAKAKHQEEWGNPDDEQKAVDE
jgi:hypothetical protein